MTSLVCSAVACSPLLADVLARRGGGGIITFFSWIVRGVASGQPVPLAFAGIGGLGVGWWIYSSVSGDGDE